MMKISSKKVNLMVEENNKELHEIRILVDGEVFAEFEVDRYQGGKFTRLVEMYLDEPDLNKW